MGTGNNKKSKQRNEEHGHETYPNISSTASTCECTGLMYSPPHSDEELESYQELSNMQIPKKDHNN